nr:MGMT family protein [Anaerolineae bacterium]
MYNPPDPEHFNQTVWLIAAQIPEGKVSTYGQIASMIPPPEGTSPVEYDRLAARWVGGSMKATPAGSGIPWHRVINSQGKISLPPGSAGAEEQRALLEIEGVVFNDKGRVDFNVVGWEGPPDDWLLEKHLLPPRRMGKASDSGEQISLF